MLIDNYTTEFKFFSDITFSYNALRQKVIPSTFFGASACHKHGSLVSNWMDQILRAGFRQGSPGAVHNLGPQGQTQTHWGPQANAVFAAISCEKWAPSPLYISGGPLK